MKNVYEQIKRELIISGKSEKTQKAYMHYIKKASEYYHKNPRAITSEEVKNYIYYLIRERKLSYSCINVAYCSLKFFFEKVMQNKLIMEKIQRIKYSQKKLPQVLARCEVKELLNNVSNLKYKCILLTIYSGGLRVSEASNLLVTDIDSKRMLIRVNQGKGKKDRYTILTNTNLKYLRKYYREYRPQKWLFHSYTLKKPISIRSIQQVFHRCRSPHYFSRKPV